MFNIILKQKITTILLTQNM